jgi:LPPG:FO 2-phospho-L-lactate transferase
MSDDPVRTIVQTAGGDLSFQRYFVAEQCRPVATGIRFEGATDARSSPGFAAAMARSDLAAVILCPSNPYLSIGPILALPGVGPAFDRLQAPVVAVSPIIGGRALKGPAAKLMQELGAPSGVGGIAYYYEGLLKGLVVDTEDAAEAERLRALDLPTLITAAIMTSDEDRARLARETLAFAAELRRSSQPNRVSP